jgi:hypothetical protein
MHALVKRVQIHGDWANDHVAVGAGGLPCGRTVKRPFPSTVLPNNARNAFFQVYHSGFAAHTAGGIGPHVFQYVLHMIQ